MVPTESATRTTAYCTVYSSFVKSYLKYDVKLHCVETKGHIINKKTR
jgi:hypothetical protein